APFGVTHYMGNRGVTGRLGPGFALSDRVNPTQSRVTDTELLGPFPVRQEVAAGMISDGLSKTLMFGECPGSIGTGIALPYGTFSGLVVGHAWAGDTTLATVSGLFSSRGTQESDAFKFSSLHSGNIVLFATCDGGVKA